MSAPTRATRLRLGVAGRPHGLRGALRVNVDNPDSDTLAELARRREPVYFDGRPLRLLKAAPLPARTSSGSSAPRAWLIELEDVVCREQADRLFRSVLEVERTALGPLEQGEFYYADLAGLACFDEAGVRIGVVDRVYEAGASDILVVVCEPGQGPAAEREVPLVDTYVLEVDVAGGRITLRLPEEEVIEAEASREPGGARPAPGEEP